MEAKLQNIDESSNGLTLEEIVRQSSPPPSVAGHCAPNGEEITETGFSYTLSLIGGKYKMTVLYWLSESKPAIRYNELKRVIGAITHKSLSQTLKELEADGLIKRRQYEQIPPKVEYSLSPRGQSLIPVLDMMCEWGTANRIQAT